MRGRKSHLLRIMTAHQGFDLGYVPLVSHSEFIPSGTQFHAAESWKTTIPENLIAPQTP